MSGVYRCGHVFASCAASVGVELHALAGWGGCVLTAGLWVSSRLRLIDSGSCAVDS